MSAYVNIWHVSAWKVNRHGPTAQQDKSRSTQSRQRKSTKNDQRIQNSPSLSTRLLQLWRSEPPTNFVEFHRGFHQALGTTAARILWTFAFLKGTAMHTPQHIMMNNRRWRPQSWRDRSFLAWHRDNETNETQVLQRNMRKQMCLNPLNKRGNGWNKAGPRLEHRKWRLLATKSTNDWVGQESRTVGLQLEHPWLHHLLIRSLHHTTKLRTHSERFSQISFLTQKPWHFMSEICFAILTILQEQGASMKDICSHLISQDDGIHNEQHEQLAKCVASSNEFEQFGIGRLSWPLCLRIMLCANQRI